MSGLDELRKRGLVLPVLATQLEKNTFWSPFEELSRYNGQRFRIERYCGLPDGSEWGHAYEIVLECGRRLIADIQELNGDYLYAREGYDGPDVLPPKTDKPTFTPPYKGLELKVTRIIRGARCVGVILERALHPDTVAACYFNAGDVYYVTSPWLPEEQNDEELNRNLIRAQNYEHEAGKQLGNKTCYAPHAWISPLIDVFDEEAARAARMYFNAVLVNCKGLVVAGSEVTEDMKALVQLAQKGGIAVFRLKPDTGLQPFSKGDKRRTKTPKVATV